MNNVMEVQQELVSRLATACRTSRAVPSQTWLAAALRHDGEGELVGLLRAVYPYAAYFEELPPNQRELLLARVRSVAAGERGAAAPLPLRRASAAV